MILFPDKEAGEKFAVEIKNAYNSLTKAGFTGRQAALIVRDLDGAVRDKFAHGHAERELRMAYDALVRAGFTEDQSFDLLPILGDKEYRYVSPGQFADDVRKTYGNFIGAKFTDKQAISAIIKSGCVEIPEEEAVILKKLCVVIKNAGIPEQDVLRMFSLEN